MGPNETTEKRLVDLEVKISHQDLLIEELNQVIYEQQKAIDNLQTLVNQLGKRFKEALGAEGEDIRGHEKPPHY